MNAGQNMLCAGISIGSHATRLLIADIQNHRYCTLARDRRVNQLFDGEPGHNLSCESIGRTVEIVEAFAEAAREAGCERIDIIATSACRDAHNTADLQSRIFSRTSLRMQVVQGEEEACLGYTACKADGARGVIDIGGGSTEIVCEDRDGIPCCVSLPIGADRLARSEMSADTRSGVLTDRIRRAAPELSGGVCLKDCCAWFGLGGTCRCLLSLENARTGDASRYLTCETVGKWEEKLSAMTAEERRRLRGMRPDKENVIQFGAQILKAIMDLFAIRGITVSGKNELDGWMQKIADQG